MAMNILTKQWFDEANTEGIQCPTTDTSKVLFKNSKTTPNGRITLDNKTYLNLKSNPPASNILLDSTDEDDDDEEDVIIDKSRLISKS